MQSIGLPKEVLIKINRIIYKFIWQKRKSNKKAFEKVKRKVMELDVSEGGVNMINIHKMQESFYLQWIGKLFRSEENWTVIPYFFLQQLGTKQNILDINCRSKTIKPEHDVKSPFWRAVMHAHLDSKPPIGLEEVSENNFQMQTLWNNNNIKYKGKGLFFQNWKNAGFERVNHIIKKDDARLLFIDEITDIIHINPASIIFEYNALVNAFPNQWKQWILEHGYLPIQQPYLFDVNKYRQKPKGIRAMLGETQKDDIKS